MLLHFGPCHDMHSRWLTLYFGNVVYIGLSSSNTLKLQSIVNTAVIHSIGSLSSSVCCSKPFPLCATVSLGWLPLIWDFSTLLSPLFLQGPLCDRPVMVFWIFRVWALLLPNSGALPTLAPKLGTVFHSPCALLQLIHCGNALRLSCLLVLKALTPFKCAVDF